MAVQVKFHAFARDLGLKVHHLNTDTLKVMLTNTAPSASAHAVKADIAEIVGGNGYTAGGHDIQNLFTGSGGVGTMTATNVVITATGGSVGPFRWAVIYNDTPTIPADPLVSYIDYGASITLLAGEPFTVSFGASVLTVQ